MKSPYGNNVSLLTTTRSGLWNFPGLPDRLRTECAISLRVVADLGGARWRLCRVECGEWLSSVRLPEDARWGASRHGKDACVVRSGSAGVDVTAGFDTESILFRLGRSAADGWLGPTKGGESSPLERSKHWT